VYEIQDATLFMGPKRLVDHLTWNIGPGQRIGILGANGAGKTSLIRMIVGEVAPSHGRVITGKTVKPAYLSQHLDELDPTWRVLEAVERIAQRVDLGKGRELTAGQLCERLGFGADGQWTPVGDLSGGERRRLQLTRLLMSAPNVLILDEPTNDFDVETLTALEDLLDGFAGTLLVVSHDRYFLERVCDDFVALLGDDAVTGLPRGVEEYLERRRAQADTRARPVAAPVAPKTVAARQREVQKVQARLERQIDKLRDRETRLHDDLATYATDYEKVTVLNDELRQVEAERETLEEEWLSFVD
jgi:ATP-binding cassette subfamily F protein uup